MILKAYKYRIYPTEKQKVLLEKHFGCARFIYNWGLSLKNKQYQETKKSDSYFTLVKHLPVLKTDKETEWLSEVSAQSLQCSLRNLDVAFTNFFRKNANFPKFKSKKSRQSFQVAQETCVDWENSKIKILKFARDGGIKAKLSRKFEGKIKTTTVSKTPSGKYYISILVETQKELPTKPLIVEQTTIGIDLGLKDFATLSNGKKIENPKALCKSLKKLQKASQKHSKKKKGSKNKEKSRIRLAKVHEKASNQRKDFLHKLSYKLTNDNQVDTICIENLNVVGLLKNRKLAKHISDSGWATFIEFLKYKSEWYGKNFVQIGRFEPSSKMCSCGKINNELTLKDRTWTCQYCNTTHDRDVLAAQNIKQFGLIKIGRGTAEYTPLEME